MSSLPAVPSLARLRRRQDGDVTAVALAAQVDAKLSLARRLRDEDQARTTTSIAPPSTPIRG
jgi:hypothetical protein